MKNKIRESGVFTPEDAKELKVLLSNKSCLRAMNSVLQLAEAKDKLTSCDLVRQEGLNEALTTTGYVRGLIAAVERIIELSQSEEENHGE